MCLLHLLCGKYHCHKNIFRFYARKNIFSTNPWDVHIHYHRFYFKQVLGDEMTTSTDIKSTPSLAIVVPCYNEQEAFPFCLEKLSNVLNSLIARNKINNNSYLLFVDDGSRDNTWAQIKDASTAYHWLC